MDNPPKQPNVTNPLKKRRGNNKRNKNKRPVMFCRPGVVQLEKKKLIQELELSIQLAALNLNQNVCESFKDMGLNPQILQGISEYGLEKPAYIQQRAIVPCIKGRDAIVQAQSGMGKTAALVISVLQRLNLLDPNCQALILAPTRELAEQIYGVFIKLSKFMTPKVTFGRCIGGKQDTNTCRKMCSEGRQVIIGTLGRTVHMLVGDGDERGPHLSIHSLKVLALDEADQLIGDGNFGRDLTTVMERIPPPSQTQIIIMSATMPGNILKLAWRFMENPATFLVRDFQLTLDGIKQYSVNVMDANDKLVTLAELFPILQNNERSHGMIFCNTRLKVQEIVQKMNIAGHELAAITGNMSQDQRDVIFEKFRRGEPGHRILITSDLLGRGIDVNQVNLVVNYDLPLKMETYIHRVGRAGRYGRRGIALSFVEEKEQEPFKSLKMFYQTEIEPMPAAHNFQNILTVAAS